MARSFSRLAERPAHELRRFLALEAVRDACRQSRLARVQANADPLNPDFREAYFLAVEKTEGALTRAMASVSEPGLVFEEGTDRLCLRPIEASLVRELAHEVARLAAAIAHRVDAIKTKEEDAPTPRPTPYPALPLAEKAALTSEAIARVSRESIRRLTEAAEGFRPWFREDVRRLRLQLIQLGQRFDERRRWLALEEEALLFLDLLTRFRDLCVACERILSLPADDPRRPVAENRLRERLEGVRQELEAHPLGRPLARLCEVRHLQTERGLRRAMRQVVAYETHALMAYGVPFHPTGRLDRRQLDRIRAQRRALEAFELRRMFLEAFFAE